MINSGVNINKALEILKAQLESPKLKVIIDGLIVKIAAGRTFSDSLKDFPEDFAEAEIGLINSGEVSGRLNTALVNLADQTEKSAQITKKLKGAMIYPSVIICIMGAAMFAVMTFVIPKIKAMFESFGAELPFITQALIDLSDFLLATGGPLGLPNALNILGGIVMTVMGIIYFKKTPAGKPLWDALMLKLPLFGALTQKVVISKLCRGIATLLSSGVPIVKAFHICSNLVGNELYKKRIIRIAEDLKIGISVADNMKADKTFFPPMMVSMIGVGEQTAKLDKVSLKMAEFYEEEVNDTIKNISSLMEPIIIVFVGLAVGGLVIAIMLPILNLSDLASSGG